MKKIQITAIVIVFMVISAACIHFSRHGYVFPGLGSLLNLAMPPEDLYGPVTLKEELTPAKRIYQFDLVHKYPGNYAIDISFSSEQQELPPLRDSDIMASLEITYDNKTIFEFKESKPNYGHYRGVMFKTHRFPDDVGKRKGMLATVKISGDIQKFLDEHGGATIAISKASDL
jgi:hypothetical protein